MTLPHEIRNEDFAFELLATVAWSATGDLSTLYAR